MLPNNITSETFLNKSGAVRRIGGYLLLGRRPGVDVGQNDLQPSF